MLTLHGVLVHNIFIFSISEGFDGLLSIHAIKEGGNEGDLFIL